MIARIVRQDKPGSMGREIQPKNTFKSQVESLLRHLGRLDQLSLFFYDLRVSPNAKVTAPPPDEPDMPVAAGDDEADED